VIFIRQAGMRTVRVQHPEQPIDVAFAVLRPFVAAFGEVANFCQERATVLGRGLGRTISTFVKGNRVKKSFKERSELGVRRRPVAPRVCLNPLTEMAERLQKAEVLEQFEIDTRCRHRRLYSHAIRLLLRPRAARERNRGNEGEQLQCGTGSTSGESGTSSPGVPIEPGTPGDCETSTKPIVLVSRVITGAPRSIELRLRMWNDGRFPLPFTTTIPCQLRAFAKVVRERGTVNRTRREWRVRGAAYG